MMHFWAEKGIDGFRLDVINLISKDQKFPNDDSQGMVGNFILMDLEFMSIYMK